MRFQVTSKLIRPNSWITQIIVYINYKILLYSTVVRGRRLAISDVTLPEYSLGKENFIIYIDYYFRKGIRQLDVCGYIKFSL